VFSTAAPVVTPPPIVPPTTTTTSTTSTTTTTSAPNLNPPTVSAFTATTASGPAPLTTAFKWTVTDPDPQPLTCSIDLEDNGVYDITINSCNSNLSRSATFATAGTKTVRFRVSDGVAAVTKTLSLSVGAASTDPFAITVRFNGTLTASQQAAFNSAATRWAQVVKTGLPDQPINVAADSCATGQPAFAGTVDDLMVDAIVTPIDGVGEILGSAGPCVVRGGGLPAYGVMRFDSADLADLEAEGLLSTVILHEMGHVLGIGTRWSAAGLISGSGGPTPLFLGNVAKGAWSAIGGGASSVPVEATGGTGTAYAHWSDAVFNNELMTGWVNSGSNPLSAITAGSLADLGYGVDLTSADAYGLPALRAPGSAGRQIKTQLIEPKFTV
jgi:PKD repeat protein